MTPHISREKAERGEKLIYSIDSEGYSVLKKAEVPSLKPYDCHERNATECAV